MPLTNDEIRDLNRILDAVDKKENPFSQVIDILLEAMEKGANVKVYWTADPAASLGITVINDPLAIAVSIEDIE